MMIPNPITTPERASAFPLRCPDHAVPLTRDADVYAGACGCRFPIINDVPRFVPQDNYAEAFGSQWNEYRTTQLDSCTGLSISRDRLTRMFGGSLAGLAGKNVLEAGCGAGRFSELMLAEDARVTAVDLSAAVEANALNCSKFPGHFVCQADIRKLPFEPGQFDIVVCVGVIQHTPNPEQTMAALCAQVRPGGLLVIDHYTYGHPAPLVRRLLRAGLLHAPPSVTLGFCRRLTGALWPAHRFLARNKKTPGVARVRSAFLKLSPVVDYHDAYPQLGPLLKTWAALDLHDTLTDTYKHLRSAEQIERHLRSCGMTDIVTAYAGNGVEARARKTAGMAADASTDARD